MLKDSRTLEQRFNDLSKDQERNRINAQKNKLKNNILAFVFGLIISFLIVWIVL